MIKKIENQLVTFNGKDKLTVDEYYSVLKVQVIFSNDLGGHIGTIWLLLFVLF